jgi:transcriptional regulator with XRE-family HTH domain
MKELIQQLLIYQLKNRISQEELAHKLGVTFSTVNRWFNGKSIPNKTQQFHILQLIYPDKSEIECLQIIARINQ